MHLMKVLALITSVLSSGCFQKNPPKKSTVLTFVSSEKSFELSIGSDIGPALKTIRFTDPNSERALTYIGHHLTTLLPKLEKELSTEHFKSLKFTSKDGYTTEISKEEIFQRNAFLALNVKGYGDKGIYNKSLKSYFDWRPAYLIFLNDAEGFQSSSPYQITEIELTKNNLKEGILSEVPPLYKDGAKVFFNTCNKCHSYKGVGGNKAPLIAVLTSKWKSDQHLKSFLRDPQKVSGRKIEMSGFKGSKSDLESLVVFLRSIEIN